MNDATLNATPPLFGTQLEEFHAAVARLKAHGHVRISSGRGAHDYRVTVRDDKATVKYRSRSISCTSKNPITGLERLATLIAEGRPWRLNFHKADQP